MTSGITENGFEDQVGRSRQVSRLSIVAVWPRIIVTITIKD